MILWLLSVHQSNSLGEETLSVSRRFGSVTAIRVEQNLEQFVTGVWGVCRDGTRTGTSPAWTTLLSVAVCSWPVWLQWSGVLSWSVIPTFLSGNVFQMVLTMQTHHRFHMRSMEFHRRVSSAAVICVEGEEQWGEDTTLGGTNADEYMLMSSSQPIDNNSQKLNILD